MAKIHYCPECQKYGYTTIADKKVECRSWNGDYYFSGYVCNHHIGEMMRIYDIVNVIR